MHRLPSEIVAETLAVLPVKYVLRCRSVCKAWRDIIDHHTFASTHLTRATQHDTTFIFVPYHRDARSLYLVERQHSTSSSSCAAAFKATEIEFHFPLKITALSFQYANGLFCLSSTNRKDVNTHTYIYNPATRDCVQLPEIPSLPKEAIVSSDLGFDSFSEEYKMVRIVSILSECREKRAHVFTLGSNSWRRLETVHNLEEHIGETAVSVNGSLNWYTLETELLTFDLRSEKFGIIPYPTDIDEAVSGVMNLGGHLSLYYYCDNGFHVWIMKEYNVKESWSKLLTIKVTTRNDFLDPISIEKNGDILLQSNGKNLVLYNVESETFTPLLIDGIPAGYSFVVNPYTGNLVSLAQQPAEEKSNQEQTTATRFSI